MSERLELTEEEKTIDEEQAENTDGLRQVEVEEVEEREVGRQILYLLDYIRVNFDRPESRLKTFFGANEVINLSSAKITLVRFPESGRLKRIHIEIDGLVISQGSTNFGLSAYFTDRSGTEIKIASNLRGGSIFLSTFGGPTSQANRLMERLKGLAGLDKTIIDELDTEPKIPKGALSSAESPEINPDRGLSRARKK